MPTDPRYVDKHGIRQIWPGSDSTRHRLMKRPVDPFPEGQIIGGKRYFRLDLVLAWLERQGTRSPTALLSVVLVALIGTSQFSSVVLSTNSRASMVQPIVMLKERTTSAAPAQGRTMRFNGKAAAMDLSRRPKSCVCHNTSIHEGTDNCLLTRTVRAV